MGVLSSLSAGAGSLIGAGISGIAGAGSSMASNIVNKDIAQMNNAFNERMLQKQMDYNTQMYQTQLNDALKYSDPSFIRGRLQSAGYNPALVGTGNLGSAVSTPSAQGINPPRATEYSQDFSGVGNAIARAVEQFQMIQNSETQRSKTNAEADQIKIENKYRTSMLIADLNKKLEETRDIKTKRMYQETLNMFVKDQQLADLSFRSAQTKQIEEQIKGQVLQNAMTSQELSFLPEAQRMQLSLGAADIALKYAQKQLTSKQAEHEVEKLAQTIVQKEGQELQNQFQKDSYQSRLRTVRATLWKTVVDSNKGHNLFSILMSGNRSSKDYLPLLDSD